MALAIHTPNGDDERALLARAEAFPEFPDLPLLTADVLRGIALHEGVDFATALLYDRVRRSPQHAPFIARIDEHQQAGARAPDKRDVVIAIVPAAFYKEKPHSGAAGHVVRETAIQLRVRCELIPLLSTGTMAENSRILLGWLTAHCDERIILVSLCKGGAEVKFALRASEAADRFANVIAWVNICGTLNGSHVARWLLATRTRFLVTWLFCRCGGINLNFLREIVPSPNSPLAAPLTLPPSLRLINIIGFPLCRHLSNGFMRRCHAAISPEGPNDGGVLLADACHLPGNLYPVWGTDHYLRPDKRARMIIAAVLRHLTDTISSSQQHALSGSPWEARSPATPSRVTETPAIDQTARTSSA